MSDQTPLDFAIGFYSVYKPENWAQLAEKAERNANRSWIQTSNSLRIMAISFQNGDTEMLRKFFASMPVINAHKLVALGAQAAIREEELSGRGLWVSPELSIKTAYSYGEVVSAADDYLSCVENAAALTSEPQLPRNVKTRIEDGLMNEADKLSALLADMRAKPLPVPAAATVVRTMRDLLLPLPDYLYQTLYTIWGEERPGWKPPDTKGTGPIL